MNQKENEENLDPAASTFTNSQTTILFPHGFRSYLFALNIKRVNSLGIFSFSQVQQKKPSIQLIQAIVPKFQCRLWIFNRSNTLFFSSTNFNFLNLNQLILPHQCILHVTKRSQALPHLNFSFSIFKKQNLKFI